MTFRWHGIIYDTSTMKAFPIGSPAMPFIYLDANRNNVFVVRVDRQEGVEVHLANPGEIKSLATRYGIPELLGTLNSDEPQAAPTPTSADALIVEDDACSRGALQNILKRSGYGIECAATVSEALVKLEENPKCLILDLNLPDGSGTALLQRIRNNNLPIKVAVTTGASDPDTLDAMGRLNPDIIFRKPVNLTDVMQWLEAAA